MANKGIIRRAKWLMRDKHGATLVEFTLTLPVLLLLTFGIVEFGYAGFQWANAEAATQRGVRLAATRDAAITNIPDCGIGVTSVPPGQPCSSDPGSYTWLVSCNAGAGGANCNAATLALILADMQKSYPKLTPANLNVTFSGAGLGFQGLGRPVPIVSVELTGLTFDFVALDALMGLPNQVAMPAFRASLTAEDLQGT